MIYFQSNDIVVRDFIESDAQTITNEEIAQGWVNQKIDKYLNRMKDQKAGKCISLAAEYQGNVAGYVNVYPNSQWGALGGRGYAEIIDFGVLEKYRKNGIGSKLMDVAEQIASKYADTVYLGVGLHRDYGSAQRMYVKRGYVPDGSGLWYKDKQLEPYAPMNNDDEACLYLSKKL